MSDIIDNFTYHPKVMTDLLNRLPIQQISENDRSILQELILDIYAAFDKNTDSEQLNTIKALHRRMQTGNLVLAKFSINGPNAGRLLIRLKGTDKTQLIKLDQRTIHPRNIKSNDSNNTVTINNNMEQVEPYQVKLLPEHLHKQNRSTQILHSLI